MGFTATDLARVPSTGYNWFIFLLEDGWDDPLRRELSGSFKKLAGEVGPTALVVQGADPKSFYDQVFYDYALRDLQSEPEHRALPALLITDTPPTEIREDRSIVERAKMVLLPLSKGYARAGSITEVLKELVIVVRSPDAFDSLMELDKEKIRAKWLKLLKYFELKPSFYGFGLDLDKIIRDICDRK